MTSEQEAMWSVLSNDAEFLCHEWAKELSNLTGDEFHEVCEQRLRFIVNNFNTQEAPRIIMTWLKQYKLELDPTKLPSFDDFHLKFGIYIIDKLETIKVY